MSRLVERIICFAAAFTFCSALGVVLEAPEALAQATGWEHGEATSKPTVADLLPMMSDDESYTERYGFAVDLDDGGHIGVDWTISNLGWGDGHGAANVRVRLPGHAGYQFTRRLGDDGWTYSDKKFDIDIADTRVRARGADSFVVTHKGERVSFELLFTNTTPMWKPGNGKITVPGGYYKFNMLAPRADVKGEVIIDGKTLQVRGSRKGYADHVATNLAPVDLATRFSRFRAYNKDVFVMWREVKLGPKHGGRSFTWIVVGYKDKIVFSDPSARLKFARVRKDSRGGYDFPMDIQVDGQSGEDTVKLVMRGTKYRRTDLLDRLAPEAKIVAAAVSKPFRYEIKCKYTLQLDIQGAKATVGGDWHFVLDYINR